MFKIPTDQGGAEIAPVYQTHSCMMCGSMYDSEGNPRAVRAFNPTDPAASPETIADGLCDRPSCLEKWQAQQQANQDAEMLAQAQALQAALANAKAAA